MIKPYWWWNSVIPKNICEHIIKNANWDQKLNGQFSSNKGDIENNEVRKTEIVWTERLDLSECILRTYITEANKNADWNFALTDIQSVQIGRYVDGGHYKFHKDEDLPSDKKIIRKLSAVLFLSDPEDYEGGAFEMQDFEMPFQKAPQGSIVIFPSYLTHRVTPVTSGERCTAVCWAIGPALK